MANGDNLAEAKRRLPLKALLQRLGLGDHAKRSARCPFRDDKRNSFSVWQTKAGQSFWKCHAGCGEGDEITFLEKHKNISSAEAIKLFKEMAGVALSAHYSKQVLPLNWSECVDAFTDKHAERLADWRGFSGELCS
jgi:hypothetical protein